MLVKCGRKGGVSRSVCSFNCEPSISRNPKRLLTQSIIKQSSFAMVNSTDGLALDFSLVQRCR